MLRHFQLPYLEQEGYVNIRCAWSLGCPREIRPFEEEGEHREAVHAGGDYKQAFQHLFPGSKVPNTIGVSCCAQFAATREKIRERRKEDYIRYRDWIIDTKLQDSISGRVLEYSWHSMSPSRPWTLPPHASCGSARSRCFFLWLLSCADIDSDLWQETCILPQCPRLLLQGLWSV